MKIDKKKYEKILEVTKNKIVSIPDVPYEDRLNSPQHAFSYAEKNGHSEELIEVIANSPDYAWKYATSILKEHHPLLFKAVRSDIEFFCEYVSDIFGDNLDQRFFDAVRYTPEYAFHYAKYYLEGSDDIILDNVRFYPTLAYEYGCQIGHRDQLIDDLLYKIDPDIVVWYARDVLCDHDDRLFDALEDCLDEQKWWYISEVLAAPMMSDGRNTFKYLKSKGFFHNPENEARFRREILNE